MQWVDVRVAEVDALTALTVCCSMKQILHYDPRPMASGPEVEISIRNVAQRDVVKALGHAGVAVLAVREQER